MLEGPWEAVPSLLARMFDCTTSTRAFLCFYLYCTVLYGKKRQRGEPGPSRDTRKHTTRTSAVGPSTFTLKEWGSNLALPSLRGDLVSRPVEVCRGLSSCRRVELSSSTTLTHRHMESRVTLSSNPVEVCRVALTSCRVTVELSPGC
jgi:hypothetical protein